MKLTIEDRNKVAEILKKCGDYDDYTSKHLILYEDDVIRFKTSSLNFMSIRELVMNGFRVNIGAPDLGDWHMWVEIVGRDELNLRFV